MSNSDSSNSNHKGNNTNYKKILVTFIIAFGIALGISYAAWSFHVHRLEQERARLEQERVRLEQEGVRLEQERAQKFENYKSSINRILNDFAQLDNTWKTENEKLYDLGKFNNGQVVYGRRASGGVGFSSILDNKQTLISNIKQIEEKMRNEAQEGLDISNNYYNDINIDPAKKIIVQQKISYFSDIISKINNHNNDNSNAGISPKTGNSTIDQALNEFSSDQNLRQLVDMWKGYKLTYDNQENDLKNRIRSGQLPNSVLENYISDINYRANQREAERLIGDRISFLRLNR